MFYDCKQLYFLTIEHTIHYLKKIYILYDIFFFNFYIKNKLQINIILYLKKNFVRKT